MDTITYNAIKLKIKQSIVLNNGYQFDDLCHDTVEKLLILKKSDTECKRLCVIVALNIIRDHHRKCRKLKIIQFSDIEGIEEKEKIKIIEPVKYRNMFILRYKLSMKYNEISESLNMPLGTVKAKISYMHQELKELNL